MPKNPKSIKTTLDVINHHNRSGLRLNRCVGCNTVIQIGTVLCPKCLSKGKAEVKRGE